MAKRTSKRRGIFIFLYCRVCPFSFRAGRGLFKKGRHPPNLNFPPGRGSGPSNPAAMGSPCVGIWAERPGTAATALPPNVSTSACPLSGAKRTFNVRFLSPKRSYASECPLSGVKRTSQQRGFLFFILPGLPLLLPRWPRPF